ncbi:Autophagy-related protein 8i [Castilleja foliolosa]|uniref:Autophagy-related protein n=1 Tax=Castilleja foliolosa TaxID=1961234 RepID=A0ABD3E0Y1_9LAMI
MDKIKCGERGSNTRPSDLQSDALPTELSPLDSCCELSSEKESAMGKAKTQPFKDQFTIEERVRESQDIIAKYPDRVPVVVEKYTIAEMEKKKFLVPRDMSVGQFIHILSGRLHLAPGKALFVFVKNTLPQTSSLIESVYDSYKDEDGFLYMCYSSEKTFGCIDHSMSHGVSLRYGDV